MKFKFNHVLVKTAALSAVFLLAFSPVALAQIGVKDVDVKRLLEYIKEINDDIKEEAVKIDGRLETSNKFEQDDTKPHYKAEIARLNAQLESLGYHTVNSSDVSAPITRADYTWLDSSTAGREAIKTLPRSDHQDQAYSLASINSATVRVGGQCVAATPLAKYLCEYGLAPATDMYPKNPDLERSMTNLYSALYLADTTVGLVDQARPDRDAVYEQLMTEAHSAADLREVMEVQNAILLENGRNLALLINLQTAQLNSDAAQLRKNARQSQIKRETFASTPASSLVLAALLAGDSVF